MKQIYVWGLRHCSSISAIPLLMKLDIINLFGRKSSVSQTSYGVIALSRVMGDQMRYLLLICLLSLISTNVLRAQPYPTESYVLEEEGTVLSEWNGNESEIDLTTDPAFAKVTTIGRYAFYGRAETLTSIKLTPKISSINKGAFWECSKLTSVELSAALDTIGDNAFYKCESLTDINIPDGCVAVGQDAFFGCRALVSIKLPSRLTEIKEGTFYECTSLPSITLPEGVETIGSMAFTRCTSLSDIQFPKKLKTIDCAAFSDCSGLTKISLPEGVTSIEMNAFSDCIKVSMVDLPSTITLIKSQAFLNCIGINTFIARMADPSKVILEEDAFLCNLVMSGGKGNLYVPKDAVEQYIANVSWKNRFGQILSIDDLPGPPKSYILSEDGMTLVEWTGAEAEINMNDYPELAKVKKIGRLAFYQKYGDATTVSVVLSDGVEELEPSAFYGCTNLTSITLPEGLKSIGDNAFFECKNLIRVKLPAGVSFVGKAAFQGCHNLASVDLPKHITNINERTFYLCPALTSITIPEGVVSIGSFAFSKCSALETIELPQSLEKIAFHAFSYCPSLRALKFPDRLTSIGDLAFYTEFEAPSLITSIELPASVSHIGICAFFNMPLTSIVIYNTEPNVFSFSGASAWSFGKGELLDSSSYKYLKAVLYVPGIALEDYKVAPIWKEFDIKPIPGTEIAFITYDAPEHGTLTLATNGIAVESGAKLLYGTEVSVEAIPEDGYELETLTANGVDIMATKKFIVKESTTVKASFRIRTHVVTLTEAENGKISIEGKTAEELKAIPHGTELTVVVTPSAGYELGTLTANDKDIKAEGKFTVTGAVTIKATFAKKTALDTPEREVTIVAIYSIEGHRLNTLQEGLNIVYYSDGTIGKILKE